MGFKPDRKVYNLKFVDDLDGLVVKARSVPLGQFIEITRMAAKFEGMSQDEIGLEGMESVEGLLEGFAGALQSWNVENDDDTPVPANYDGLKSQEFDFVLRIITAWIEAIAQVAVPLAPGSSAGKQFPEGTIPMETASPSLAS